MMNKDDLISREAALACFHSRVDRHGNVHTPDEMAEYRAIEELPPAQPEIIRCKDCKHYEGGWYCSAWNNSPGFPMVTEEGYCDLAERREHG